MKQRLLAMLLSLGVFASMTAMIPTVSAAYASDPQAEIQTTRSFTTSDRGVEFLAEMKAAYGGNAISQANAEAVVNSFMNSIDPELNQQQFDALVDFVAENGSGMLSNGYRVQKVIASGSYTDAELASAFCAWVKQGSSFSQDKLNRRLRQIKLFLYGDYEGNQATVNFRYVRYNANGGSLNDNLVICYTLGSTYGTLPTASRSGWYFGGWYTSEAGGTQLTNSDTVTSNQTVYAHWRTSASDNPNESDGVLHTSEKQIELIKQHEGFIKYPIWDNGHYTVGYGSQCNPGDYPNGITEEEADRLLRKMLEEVFEPTLNDFLAKGTEQHTQYQYDALINISYNLGQQWMSTKYNIGRYVLYGGYTEMELVNTFGSWCRAGGKVLPGLMNGRIDEANLYLNGDYTFRSYAYLGVIFDAGEGECEKDVYYYKKHIPLGWLPGATRSGYHLVGWVDKDGTLYDASTVVDFGGVLTLTAKWAEGEAPQKPDIDVPPSEDLPPDDLPSDGLGYSDVAPSAWYYEYVNRAVELGIFNGVADNRFNPDGTMNRAMMATVLYRIAGSPEVSGTTDFTDVEEGSWYYDAIVWAQQNGIVNGLSSSRFGVKENVTREQLTAMLYRYAMTLPDAVPESAGLEEFTDAAQVSDYALSAVQWAVAKGILNGSDGKLLPQGQATRAQCAKMLVVYLEGSK